MSGESPLRIIMVGPMPPPFGGMANQTRQLIELLRGEGVEVDVVLVNAPCRPSWVGRIPVLRALVRLLPYLWMLWRVTRHGRIMHVMANSGWSWHLFAAPAILIARMRKVPLVVNYRGGEAESFMAKQSRWVLPVLRMAQVVAVPSGFLEHVFANYGVTTTIVPNIVDLSRFGESWVERESNPSAPHIIVTRNLEALYDNATAIRAFALLRLDYAEAKLTIAGSGPELRALRSLAWSLDLGESVVFAGRLEREQMAALYRSADIMLNPSRADNMPNSVLEAWASGVAVISTDVGGVPFLVEDGENAVLVPMGDAVAMAQEALKLLSDRTSRTNMIRAGHEASRRFCWEKVRPRWFDIYGCLKQQTVEGAHAT